ncbi:MAG: hypothetical protein ACK5MS_02895, partial [Planctomyces sp.]
FIHTDPGRDREGSGRECRIRTGGLGISGGSWCEHERVSEFILRPAQRSGEFNVHPESCFEFRALQLLWLEIPVDQRIWAVVAMGRTRRQQGHGQGKWQQDRSKNLQVHHGRTPLEWRTNMGTPAGYSDVIAAACQ